MEAMFVAIIFLFHLITRVNLPWISIVGLAASEQSARPPPVVSLQEINKLKLNLFLEYKTIHEVGQ